VDPAVNVILRKGTRSSPAHRRFGDLAGARRADAKGHSALTHHHPEREAHLEHHPMEVVRRWLHLMEEGQPGALMLYAPDARLHRGTLTLSGRRSIAPQLADIRSQFATAEFDLIGEDDGVLLRRRSPEGRASGRDLRFHIAHGQIVEQWA
jgi:hypothetical protein